MIQSRYDRLDVENHHYYNVSTQKVWAHRGYAEEPRGDTLASIRASVAKGAPGIELDIAYDAKAKHFIVANPKAGAKAAPLRLKTILIEFGEKTHYWLNFTNLADLAYSEAGTAAHQLAVMATRYTKRPFVMVESDSASHLAPFKPLGIHTALATSLPMHSSWPIRLYETLKLKYLLGANGITAVTLEKDQFDQQLADGLPNTDVYIQHVNSLDDAQRFAQVPAVKIILPDEDLLKPDVL
ncbi:hypothetical protein [Kordiimonas sp.]|uniref:hypothetical protein n=1 Tax=Kordiimonas sp. TaxID=1970157 RepID=UPI003A9279D6